MQPFVGLPPHVLWTGRRVIAPELRPKPAPDLLGLTGGPVAVSLTGGGVHQAGAGSAQEARLRAVEVEGATSAPGAEEVRLVPSEGLWNAGQDDGLVDHLPVVGALAEPEVQSDFIGSAIDPDPAGRLTIAIGPAPTPAPAFAEDACPRHPVGGELAMRLHNAPAPHIVSA